MYRFVKVSVVFSKKKTKKLRVSFCSKLLNTLVTDNLSRSENEGSADKMTATKQSKSIGVIKKPVKHMLQHMVQRGEPDLICHQTV